MIEEVRGHKYICDECKKEEIILNGRWGYLNEQPKGWGSVAALCYVTDSGKKSVRYNQIFCADCYPKMLEKKEIQEVFK